MPALLAEPPSTASTAIEVGSHADSTLGTVATAVSYVVAQASEDPFVEAPIAFVPGLEARPTRAPQDEPEGSGPFGF